MWKTFTSLHPLELVYSLQRTYHFKALSLIIFGQRLEFLAHFWLKSIFGTAERKEGPKADRVTKSPQISQFSGGYVFS